MQCRSHRYRHHSYCCADFRWSTCKKWFCGESADTTDRDKTKCALWLRVDATLCDADDGLIECVLLRSASAHRTRCGANNVLSRFWGILDPADRAGRTEKLINAASSDCVAVVIRDRNAAFRQNATGRVSPVSTNPWQKVTGAMLSTACYGASEVEHVV